MRVTPNISKRDIGPETWRRDPSLSWANRRRHDAIDPGTATDPAALIVRL